MVRLTDYNTYVKLSLGFAVLCWPQPLYFLRRRRRVATLVGAASAAIPISLWQHEIH